MSPVSSRTWLYLVVILTGSLLSACMSGVSPSTRYYVLNPIDSDTRPADGVAGRRPLSLEISSLRLPQYLERPHIVTRRGDSRLDLAEFHQWGGNLRKNTVRVIAKNLSHILATSRISMAPYHPPVPPDFRLEVEIMRFERDTDGRVKLSAQWRLVWGKRMKSVETQISELVGSETYTGWNYERIVSSMGALVGELSEIIGRKVLELAYENGEPGD